MSEARSRGDGRADQDNTGIVDHLARLPSEAGGWKKSDLVITIEILGRWVLHNPQVIDERSIL